jgi:ABC-2 type transport system ATP-binding protein
MKAVEARELTKAFGTFVAVDHISFEVERGEIFGFLGANGAGKTTTIRMLCGLLRPSEGEGRVVGLDIRRETQRIRERIGYMSQKFSLYEDLRVDENIAFWGGAYGLWGPGLAERRSHVVEMLGLDPFCDRMTRDLPLGWKQRVALGCALLHSPEVLFLDEPTAGVDPISRRQFWKIIAGMAEDGITVFVTTHYMEEAEYCSRLSIMHAGRIVALDSPEHLRRSLGLSSMQEVFVRLVGEEAE